MPYQSGPIIQNLLRSGSIGMNASGEESVDVGHVVPYAVSIEQLDNIDSAPSHGKSHRRASISARGLGIAAVPQQQLDQLRRAVTLDGRCHRADRRIAGAVVTQQVCRKG